MAKAAATETEIAALIFDVIPGVMRVLRRVLRASASLDLTIPQWRVLAHVNRGAATAAELAELQGVSMVAICKMLDGLVTRGLLGREHRDGNRKQLFLSLTPAGRALYLKTRREAQRVISDELARTSRQGRVEMKVGLLAMQNFFGSLPGSAPSAHTR